MPELPDIAVYIECLERRIVGEILENVRIGHPFLVRTVDPPIKSAAGKRVLGLRRIGKRIAIGLEDDLHIVLHLMIAGRLQWRDPGAALPGKRGLAAFDFAPGALILTEAGAKRRASLHMARGEDGLNALDPGGIEPLESTPESFGAALTDANSPSSGRSPIRIS